MKEERKVLSRKGAAQSIVGEHRESIQPSRGGLRSSPKRYYLSEWYCAQKQELGRRGKAVHTEPKHLFTAISWALICAKHFRRVI